IAAGVVRHSLDELIDILVLQGARITLYTSCYAPHQTCGRRRFGVHLLCRDARRPGKLSSHLGAARDLAVEKLLCLAGQIRRCLAKLLAGTPLIVTADR